MQKMITVDEFVSNPEYWTPVGDSRYVGNKRLSDEERKSRLNSIRVFIKKIKTSKGDRHHVRISLGKEVCDRINIGSKVSISLSKQNHLHNYISISPVSDEDISCYKIYIRNKKEFIYNEMSFTVKPSLIPINANNLRKSIKVDYTYCEDVKTLLLDLSPLVK